MSRSSFLVAVASVSSAAQSGPAALFLCDSMVEAMDEHRMQDRRLSERELILARAAAAAARQGQAEPAAVRPFRLPRISVRRVLESFRLRRPRLAA